MSSKPNLNRPIILNGFEVELPAEVEAIVRPMPDPSDVKTERTRLEGFWFVHWVNGSLYCLRLKGGGPNVAGKPESIAVKERPWLMRARLDDAIESVFERYSAIRHRPFTFLAQREEIVLTASAKANIQHPLLGDFRILPKFSLHAKVIEPHDGQVKLGLFVTLGMRHEANADLNALIANGVDLSGLYVVRRKPKQGERRFVGRIGRIENGTVHLSETLDSQTIRIEQVQLEGSLEVFAHCLKAILGKLLAHRQ
jgi:hypothetical protein